MIKTCIRPDADFERLRHAILRDRLPDRVPFIELGADAEIQEAVLGRSLPRGDEWETRLIRVQDSIEFNYRLGYDYVNVVCTPSFPAPNREAADTAVRRHVARSWKVSTDNAISGHEDFEKYPWPEANDDCLALAESASKQLREGMKIIAVSGGVLGNTTWILGYENLCIKLVEDRPFVKDVVDRVGELQWKAMKQAIEIENVGVLWSSDDLGFKTQTLISPCDLRELLLPWHKKFVALAHSRGLPAILHSCGNLEEIMEDLIGDCGYDGKHSFEDVIMPIEEVKDKYGERVSILGGIDVDFLARGTTKEVRDRTRAVLEHCMVGGGYCLGTGNTVANYIPVENYLAMLETGWEFGRY